jgi:1-aminocyclopropane-1-carboxylate deaminase/D-cysteine desulfhydrase-like pyridoxal-dependent ACC family enzyme
MVEKQSGMQKVEKLKNDKQKIVITGDSHVRNCAAKLQQQLGRKCAVSGYVKPGAGMKVIVSSAKEEIGKLNREDVVIVWWGSNDIGKRNYQEALRHLCKFVDQNQNVNVIVMSAPHIL